MKKFIVCVQLCIIISLSGYTQVIPFGISNDSLFIQTPPNTIMGEPYYEFNLYKPASYSITSSPILWYVHGSGGSGTEGISILQQIAERRNALIVSPTMQQGLGGWAYVSNGYGDTISGCSYVFWSTQIFKQIYRYVLQRENRDSVPCYLTGFSQGGQFVTRYMLVRQFDPDSIPIVMSASVDPANYTLCTENFDGTSMDWTWYRCGLSGNSPTVYCNGWEYTPVNSLICNSHVKQYYNENYAVLIGTSDTATFQGFCSGQGGNNRYERAIAFYNFSDTNAINRGTSLRWEYAEIPDIGHNGYALYNTVAAGDSIPIAERVLFETPWHPVPDFSPLAAFSYSDTGLTVNFTDLTEYADNFWYWDFGDGDTSVVQNPQHSFAAPGTYYVCLTAGDSCISNVYCDSITVTSVGINNIEAIQDYKIYPNPFSQTTTLEFNNYRKPNEMYFTIHDQTGRMVKMLRIEDSRTNIQCKELYDGIYFYEILDNQHILGRGKLVKIKE